MRAVADHAVLIFVAMKMKFVRRWLIYRRLVNELVDVPAGSLDELGTSPKTIHDFAWQCARIEVDREPPITPRV